MKISNRLKKIASFVLKTEDAYLLDVGCDHALLAIYVALNNPNIKMFLENVEMKKEWAEEMDKQLEEPHILFNSKLNYHLINHMNKEI